MKTILIAAAVSWIAVPTLADVSVAFDEGAPKDRFTISNLGVCPLADVTVLLDLGASAAGLIFDVTAAGAGVSVYQPLELVVGQEALASVPEVRDGDNRIALPIRALAPGQEISFTIDVDDTAGSSATMVSGSEIAGARVLVGVGTGMAQAAFTDQAIARVNYSSCNT